jgi:hypothetical protein
MCSTDLFKKFLWNHFPIKFSNSNFIQVLILKSTISYTGDDITNNMISATHHTSQFSQLLVYLKQ